MLGGEGAWGCEDGLYFKQSCGNWPQEGGDIYQRVGRGTWIHHATIWENIQIGGAASPKAQGKSVSETFQEEDGGWCLGVNFVTSYFLSHIGLFVVDVLL